MVAMALVVNIPVVDITVVNAPGMQIGLLQALTIDALMGEEWRVFVF